MSFCSFFTFHVKSFDLVFLFSGLNRPLMNHVRSGSSMEPCLEYLSLVYPGLGQINFFNLGSFLSWGLFGLTAFGANHKKINNKFSMLPTKIGLPARVVS